MRYRFLSRTWILVLFNAIFWVGAFLFYSYFLGYGSGNDRYVKYFSLGILPVTIVISFVGSYYLLPQYLMRNKVKLFALYSIYTLIVSFFFTNVSILYTTIFLEYLNPQRTIVLIRTLPLINVGIYFVSLLHFGCHLVFFMVESSLKQEEMKSKFLETKLLLKEQELKSLKAQIHPHFLFNTLNTLYGLALQKSDDTPDMILKISHLLDYILYQIEKPLVPLSEELSHLRDYIDLEKMRIGETADIRFVSTLADEHDIQIAPMLLIFFVENSFKHGSYRDGKLSIDIEIEAIGELLKFKVCNSHEPRVGGHQGIGLENIKRRLALVYPDRHELEVTEEPSLFQVTLELHIA